MLRCRSIASLQRTVSTPPLVDISRASHLDLFEQPARGFFSTLLDQPEWRSVKDKILARRIGPVRASLLTARLNRRDSELPRRARGRTSVSRLTFLRILQRIKQPLQRFKVGGFGEMEIEPRGLRALAVFGLAPAR